MFNGISSDGKGNEEECVANSKVVSTLAKKFGIGQWSFIGSGFREEVVFYWKRIDHKEFEIILRKRCCWNSLKVDVQFSVQQLHCPGVSSKGKGHGKLSTHFAADQETIENIFRIIVFANQLSLYGAVENICEECESLHDRSG